MRASLAETGGRNMRPGFAWDAVLCPIGGFAGYQPKQSEQDRSSDLS
ncbi:MAG TPA: hypothetical protein PKD26_02395 [Pyrinomonadaceae bacterium]|nr:hypothetical protein [Pyrinomonadaceae bacterium]